MESTIVHTAFQLMKKIGVRNFTLELLSAETGLSKKKIHQHFATKEEILLAVIRSNVARLKELAGEAGKESPDPVTRVAVILELHLQESVLYPESFLFELRKYHADAYALVNDYLQELFYETVVPLLADAQEKGMIEKEVDCRLVAGMFLYRFRDIIGESRAYRPRSFAQWSDHLVLYPLRGLLSKTYIGLFDAKLSHRD